MRNCFWMSLRTMIDLKNRVNDIFFLLRVYGKYLFILYYITILMKKMTPNFPFTILMIINLSKKKIMIHDSHIKCYKLHRNIHKDSLYI